MLEKIALLDSHVIRALLVAIVGVLGLVLSWFGVNETVFSTEAAKAVDALMLLFTTGGIVYAGYARAMKPTPPLTDAAVEKTNALKVKQLGSSLVLLMGVTLMAISLAGCAALAPPKSFDDRLAYAYGVHTAVQTAAANSVTAHDLSGANGEQVLKLADDARHVLDAARAAAGAGDAKTAEGQLALATNILTQLQTYLRSKSP